MPQRDIAKALLALLLVVSTAGAQTGKPDGLPAAGSLPFFLSSDAVRALRDVGPSPQMILRWKWSTEVLQRDGAAPRENSGTLTLGPDYLMSETPEGKLIFDLRLRRRFILDAGGASFGNDRLFAEVDFFDMEAINRAAIRRGLEATCRTEGAGPANRAAPG